MTRKSVLFFLSATVVVLVVGLLMLILFQRRLMYFPSSARPAVPADMVEIVLKTDDGALIAWSRPAIQGRPTALFFNGNAGTMDSAVAMTEPLARRGYGLLLVSYPGYDGNPGRPTEQGLYRAGRAALAWLDSRGIGTPLIIGWSLGSGVAVEMAVEHASCGLVLLAPFTSAVNVAARQFPFLPLKILMRDHYDSEAKLMKLHVPFLLILHGAADPVIPLSEGQALFAAAPGPKRLIIVPEAGHAVPIDPALAELEIRIPFQH